MRSQFLTMLPTNSVACIAVMQRTNSMLFANFNQDFTCVLLSLVSLCTPDRFFQMYFCWDAQRL